MDRTAIEWTDATWNPLRGCTRVSAGCQNCYAERHAARFGGFVRDGVPLPYQGLAEMTPHGPRWTGEVRLIEDKIEDPLRWRRPRRIFVNSMSDLFHEKVPDEWLDRIFAVMALAPQHTFQVLTKRPERMAAYFGQFPDRGFQIFDLMGKHLEKIAAWRKYGASFKWPLPNVWLGVSVEDQATADARIPLLLQTPAAVRWISAEPLLGPMNLDGWIEEKGFEVTHSDEDALDGEDWGRFRRALNRWEPVLPRLNWVVVGGESGPGARPFDVAWADSIVKQCKAAGVPVFVKQLGAYPILDPRYDRTLAGARRLRDRKGGDMAEWPEDLRVREFPGG